MYVLRTAKFDRDHTDHDIRRKSYGFCLEEKRNETIK